MAELSSENSNWERNEETQRGHVMRQQFIAALLTAFVTPAAADDVAPGGTLRAAYIGTNPAQATRDAATGMTRGPSYDLTVELAKRLGVAVDMKPVAGPAAVIAAVSGGEADIGFIAYEPSRAGTIEFSQTYLLVQQSFVVLDGSSIRTIAEIDRPGQKVAGVRDDSISLYLRRHLKQATLVEIANNPAETKRMLANKEIDAFGASRPRLSALVAEMPGTRLVPDNLFGVPQTVIVPKGKAAALETLNRFIDDARASGFLKTAIEKSGVVGLEVAPGGSWQPTSP
jgi:polar amino acid transport system substrate-binding protein